MSQPTAGDMIRLKRIVRYIRTVPRMAAKFAWKIPSRSIEVYTDSDHAGCPLTRKSKLGALTKACAEGLGMKALLNDFQVQVEIKVLSDATAAIAMVRRLGLGKVRHLAVADLWIQQRVRSH